MDILHVALLISLASLGVRAITDKGMILYFLRKPFDKKQDRLNEWNQLTDELVDLESFIAKEEESEFVMQERTKAQANLSHVRVRLAEIEDESMIGIDEIILYIMKPIFLCSTCMSSVHTLIWWSVIDFPWNYNVVLVMLIVASLNTLIWLTVEALRKTLK